LTTKSALRLSKLLRDNRHTFMAVLQEFEQAGTVAFLLFLLNLPFADFDVGFRPRVVQIILLSCGFEDDSTHDQVMPPSKRRRCRIALRALRDYFRKANRSTYVISTMRVNERSNRLSICSLRRRRLSGGSTLKPRVFYAAPPMIIWKSGCAAW